jgi:hypothetical protein
MKKLRVAALAAGQIVAGAAPALAQSYAPVRETETGAFGGLRVRVPFGGAAREPVRAGLAFAPVSRTDHQDGRVRTRIGEGLEFGFRQGRPVSFSLAGRDLSSFRLNAAQNEGRDRRGFPWGTAALVVGGIVVAGLIATAVVFNNILENERSGPDGS